MIKVAFYKAEYGDWTDKLISWFTRSPYSHCELIIDDLWYSSSPRDLRVRARAIQLDYKWRVVSLECSDEQKAIAKRVFDERMGAKYDFIGILFSQLIPLSIDTSSKYFCSEICSLALQRANLLKRDKSPNWFSPARLFNELV